jgi:hypothetical protein
MPLEGLQIGRYRFIRKLGSGGMGEVYLAEDARISQQVAIKVIQSEASPYPNADTTIHATRLFQHEAMAIARLDHPHILPLFDYGEASINGTTLTYLVMPFRREGSLIDWLGRRGGSELLSPQDVAHIVSQTADALQHSHDHQIIHQDIKPSNLLIRETSEAPNRPDVLLADFGIAKFTTATSVTSQVIRGTPTYMAPEQWAGRPVPAADQYALAVMAYELLTSRPPFQGGSMQLMYQHLSVQPQAPSTLNAALPADVDTVLLHALAKEPSKRFASVAAFAQAFRQSVQYAGVAPRVGMPSPLITPDFSREKDIYAVLAISEAEAGNGTTRALTLPGGRRVRVSVPAGIQDGQIIRLEGQGEQAEPGGPMSALMLIITVKQTTDEVVHPGYATGTEPTIAPTKIRGQASGVSEASSTGSATGAHAPGNTGNQPTIAAGSEPRGIPPSPAHAANENVVVGPTILPTPVVRDASARGGSGAGARRSMRRWWLVIASMLFALLLIFGGAVYAVPNGINAFFNGFWSSPAPVSPSPIHLTPGSIHQTPTIIPPTPTTAPHPTARPSPTPYPTATTAAPTEKPSPHPTPSPYPTATATPSSSPTTAPTPTPTTAPNPTPTAAPTPTPTTAAPTPTPTPYLTATPTTAAPTATATPSTSTSPTP